MAVYRILISSKLCLLHRLFDGELNYVDQLLEEDVRNNSAWNQRHFTITQTTGFTKEVIQREVEYTKAAITKVVDNESPWSYLRGLVDIDDWGSGKSTWVRGRTHRQVRIYRGFT